MDDPNWLSEDEVRTWRGLSLMNLQLNAVLSRALVEDGLSHQDYHVLAGLSDSGNGSIRLHEIGHHLGWEKSRVSHHINRMATRGLVEKIKCPSDKRGWNVVMTEAGREAITQAAPGHVELVRRYFIDLLTAEQLHTLDEIATTVLAHLPDESA